MLVALESSSSSSINSSHGAVKNQKAEEKNCDNGSSNCLDVVKVVLAVAVVNVVSGLLKIEKQKKKKI